MYRIDFFSKNIILNVFIMSFTIDQISFFQYSINNTILLVSKDLLVNSVINKCIRTYGDVQIPCNY